MRRNILIVVVLLLPFILTFLLPFSSLLIFSSASSLFPDFSPSSRFHFFLLGFHFFCPSSSLLTSFSFPPPFDILSTCRGKNFKNSRNNCVVCMLVCVCVFSSQLYEAVSLYDYCIDKLFTKLVSSHVLVFLLFSLSLHEFLFWFLTSHSCSQSFFKTHCFFFQNVFFV